MSSVRVIIIVIAATAGALLDAHGCPLVLAMMAAGGIAYALDEIVA